MLSIKLIRKNETEQFSFCNAKQKYQKWKICNIKEMIFFSMDIFLLKRCYVNISEIDTKVDFMSFGHLDFS